MKMKKILALIFAFLMALGFAGCAEYSEATKNPGSGTSSDNKNPSGSDNNPQDENYFSVHLVCADEEFVYDEDYGIDAIWSNGMSVYRASFDADGIAKAYGLDGDYTVTLSAIPEGYTYNSNIYYATNYSRETEITLYKLQEQVGSRKYLSLNGSNVTAYVYNISSMGVYRATLESPSSIVYFSFRPTENGLYSITSIMDITANVINPIIDTYTGSSVSGYFMLNDTVDTGGSSNTYTKNFKWEMNLTSNWDGFFGVRAECLKADAFPVDIDFILDKDGEYMNTDYDYISHSVEETFEKTLPFEQGKFTWMASTGTNGLLDGSRIVFNESDGWYHVDSADGPVLYAGIYYSEVLGGNGFNNEQVSRKVAGSDTNGIYDSDGRGDAVDADIVPYAYDYTEFINTYALHMNIDKVYPVTKEMRLFLQRYAISKGYFMDGDGYAEKYLGYNSSESDQWLWNCGYYK